ncbi:MAG: MBL fold metallo-hydrolase [Thermoprotei archaeon]|nr:MBL fold metallo-hydrolase [Thermoprotei archaeon]
MVLKIKLVILVDNEHGPDLRGEWGLSIYVETDQWRALFDADTDPHLLRYNAEKLKVDLSKLDYALLSHYHYDHMGGFEYLGELHPGLTVYVPPGPSETLHNWGLRVITVRKNMMIAEDAYVIGPLKAWSAFYENAFVVRVKEKGLVVLVGCSHPGVDKFVTRARDFVGERVFLVIGGYHSPNRRTLDALASISSHISPIHCSGNRVKEYVKRKYPEKYIDARTGTTIEF